MSETTRFSEFDMRACEMSSWSGGKRNCRLCDKPLSEGRRRWCTPYCATWANSNHAWTQAKRAMKRGVRACRACGARTKLEVNHIEPARGKHAIIGCHHHLENLEYLCSPCHKVETKRQHAAGELK